MPGFPFPEFIQPDPYPVKIPYIMSKGNFGQRAGPPEQEERHKNPGKEQFCSWQKREISSPVRPGLSQTSFVFSS
jgi:hypothetical protein